MTIKGLRKLKDVKQAEMAKLLGVTQQHYSDMERGRRRWQPEHLTAISKELGYPEEFIKLLAEQQKEAQDDD